MRMPQTAVFLDVNWLPEREVAHGFQHPEPAPHHTVVFSLHETLLRKGCHARRARLPCPPDRPAGSPRQRKADQLLGLRVVACQCQGATRRITNGMAVPSNIRCIDHVEDAHDMAAWQVCLTATHAGRSSPKRVTSLGAREFTRLGVLRTSRGAYCVVMER